MYASGIHVHHTVHTYPSSLVDPFLPAIGQRPVHVILRSVVLEHLLLLLWVEKALVVVGLAPGVAALLPLGMGRQQGGVGAQPGGGARVVVHVVDPSSVVHPPLPPGDGQQEVIVANPCLPTAQTITNR